MLSFGVPMGGCQFVHAAHEFAGAIGLSCGAPFPFCPVPGTQRSRPGGRLK